MVCIYVSMSDCIYVCMYHTGKGVHCDAHEHTFLQTDIQVQGRQYALGRRGLAEVIEI
jgi:hypothetical protein